MTSTSVAGPILPEHIRTCPTCGLAQQLPERPPRRSRICCARCQTTLDDPIRRMRSRSRTTALAAAALLLYPFAMLTPMLQIEQFGHATESSIVAGVATLIGGGHWFIGLVILFCSVVLPLAKLIGLLVLASGAFALRDHHQARTYRLVEWTGRWGMLDVLLVAILVAGLKLGDMVTVTPGPAAASFTMLVVLSLLAAASFDPHGLWRASGDRAHD